MMTQSGDHIPVVQGTPVHQHGYTEAPSGGGADHPIYSTGAGPFDNGKIYTPQELRQERQNPSKQYKDVAWALVFVAQLLLVIMMCLYLIGTTNQGGGNARGGGTYGGVFFVVGVTGFLSIALSCASLSFMMKNAEMLVQSALIFSVATSFFMGVVGFFTGNLLMGVIGLAAGVVGCCYAYFVWGRIPFAAANLKTALAAVKCNLGLFVLALGMSAIGMGWSVLWFMGVGTALSSNSLPVVFLLFLSYYWTHEVLRNTVHVTSAVSQILTSTASSPWNNLLLMGRSI